MKGKVKAPVKAKGKVKSITIVKATTKKGKMC